MPLRNFNAELWSERLGLPYVANNWYNYTFRRQFKMNGKLTKNKVNGSVKNVSGRVLKTQLYMMLPAMLNGEWDKCCSLYGGIIAFLLKRCKNDITYFEHHGRRDEVSVRQCCENLSFPHWCKEDLEKVFKSTFCFEDYLRGFGKTKHVNFDIKSAVMIVKMQGEEAIFSVLMQLFHVGKYVYTNTANLVPSLPIIWTPEVSHLANSTGFPLVVTKFSDKLSWRWIQDGCFLFDEYNNVIDCACVGRFNVFNESLGNRLSFVGRSGCRCEYLVCWTWDDLFDAVAYFNGDLLVRNMSGGFDGWYKFGPNAQLVIWTKGRYVFARGQKKPIHGLLLEPVKSRDKVLDVVNICGEKVDVDPPEEQVWTVEELKTWFEIGKICKKRLEGDMF